MKARLTLLVCGDRPPPRPEEVAGVTCEVVAPPRLGVDTQLYRVPGTVDPAIVMRVGDATDVLRISIEGDSLAEVHARGADTLEAIAALDAARRLVAPDPGEDLAVVDLFCLEARAIDEAIGRLRADEIGARMIIGVRPHAGDEDAIDLETYGLRKLGMREILVPAVPKALAETVGTFLNDVARYAARSRKPIEAGDAVAFGWVDVRPLAAEELEVFPDDPAACAPRFLRDALGAPGDLPGMLVMCEPASDEAGAPLRAGVTRAAEIVATMIASARQCGVEQAIDVPRGQQTAVVSRRLAGGGPAQLRRLERDEITASGWVAVATDQEALDDPAEFEVVPLVTLATWLPRAFSLLALPAGSGITFAADDTLTIYLP